MLHVEVAQCRAAGFNRQVAGSTPALDAISADVVLLTGIGTSGGSSPSGRTFRGRSSNGLHEQPAEAGRMQVRILPTPPVSSCAISSAGRAPTLWRSGGRGFKSLMAPNTRSYLSWQRTETMELGAAGSNPVDRAQLRPGGIHFSQSWPGISSMACGSPGAHQHKARVCMWQSSSCPHRLQRETFLATSFAI